MLKAALALSNISILTNAEPQGIFPTFDLTRLDVYKWNICDDTSLMWKVLQVGLETDAVIYVLRLHLSCK